VPERRELALLPLSDLGRKAAQAAGLDGGHPNGAVSFEHNDTRSWTRAPFQERSHVHGEKSEISYNHRIAVSPQTDP
jgi:hypothetical protein